MLERYYKHPGWMAPLRAGLLGGYVDRFAAWLAERDYKRDTAATYIRYASHLGRWLATTGRALETLDEAQVAEFVTQIPNLSYVNRTNRAKSSKEIQAAMRLILRRLRDDGVIHTQAPTPDPVPTLIEDFEAWMVKHREVRTRTMRKGCRPVLRRFLASLGEEPERYTPGAIRAFILDWAVQLGRDRVMTRLYPIRAFLRYLSIIGRCPTGLAGAVPKIAPWKLTSLPRWIPAEAVQRIVDSCDLSRGAGVRDRSILLLLARLGLRATDVAGLRFDDIDWAAGRIWVCGKTSRKAALPLPQDVGDALLAYLESRPVVPCDHVFVGVRAPHAPLGAESVTAAVVRAARRAQVALPKVGSHVLRHSLATSLLGDGMSLAGIGAVLRHANLDTTRVYAKVDVGTLGMVVRPWPLEVP